MTSILPYTVPDCLVLKLEEITRNTENDIDATVYIIYDTLKETYVIRGNRRVLPNVYARDFSFECRSSRETAQFLEYIICKGSRVNEVLYNYDNLPNNANDITFCFLRDHENAEYEIAGFNKIMFHKKRLKNDKKRLKNVLRILRSTSNQYNTTE
jgi:hypothetical protein